MRNKRMGHESMGNKRMESEKMGSEKMGSEKMGSERMISGRMISGRMIRESMKVVGFWVMTILLVLAGAMCVAGTVRSQVKSEVLEMESYYREQEKSLVRKTREYLNQAGFSNSGVTLTSVIDADGSREYRIIVHHGKIDKMDEQSRENLKRELSSLVFVAEGCTFYHEFLVTD